MKKIYKLSFLFVLLFTAFNLNAQNTATVTATNFEIINNGANFRFDVHALRTSVAAFDMGNSSFVMDYAPGALNNAVLSNQNSRFSTGNYNSMTSAVFFGQQVALQINFNFGGPGEEITNVPGSTGFGERLATITMDILQNVQANLVWDPSSSDIVTTNFTPVTSTYNGNYNGTLPVELTSFVSAISNNSVTLSWATASELNNKGFDIERKPLVENSTWSKIGFVDGNGTVNETKNYSYRDQNLATGNYSYRLKQVDFNGNFEYFNLQNEVIIGIPQKFALDQNYPNPFNPSTKINFSLPVDSKVTLNIYDLSGKLVQTLINNELKSANYYTVQFNGANLSSGAYFYSLVTGENSDTKKMILIK
ncbi:MAG TPA: T9SS type A sorting domain-containing protein [Ignavibacteria bacterium]|nr:T9SS type A sorting domain-containing protein [Ignavibacteria bacterium]HQY52600.1 T9SS type A sorting domain-containing protein [Ignavibacteria bacterium]HRB00601.1 T9SS type A sorting domain-containing protein [Ignavibacteria bacterium]